MTLVGTGETAAAREHTEDEDPFVEVSFPKLAFECALQTCGVAFSFAATCFVFFLSTPSRVAPPSDTAGF